MFGISAGVMTRGTVIRVQRGNTDALRMMFDVACEDGRHTTGDTPGVITNVVLLVSGFQALTHREPAPGGIVYVPEVGSRVLCIHDGVRWCILGFYTGPIESPADQAEDKSAEAKSYNAGVGSAMNRSELTTEIPSWDFGIKEGEIALSRGIARLKIGEFGVVVGADIHASTIYKKDGEVLTTAATETTRNMGYTRVQTYSLGLDGQVLPEAMREASAAATAFAYRAEVIEASPIYRSRKAFVLHQRGFVADSVLNDGRAAVSVQPSSTDAAAEAYVVIRDLVARPKTGTKPDYRTPELDTSAATVYDYQVDNDGSIRLRAGNTGGRVGAQRRRKNTLDFEFAYDAATGSFKLQVGKAGAPLAGVTIDGLKGMVDVISSTRSRLGAGKPGVAPTSYIEVTPDHVLISAPIVKVPGRIEVITARTLVVEQDASVGQNLAVGQDASAGSVAAGTVAAGTVTAGTVTAGGVELSKHVHKVKAEYGVQPPVVLDETSTGQ